MRNPVGGPVKLWREIIDPSFVEPEFGICIKFIVLIKAFHRSRESRAPDPKGTQSEFHMLFFGFDLLIESLDQFVHRFPSPVATLEFTAIAYIFVPAMPRVG